MDDQTEPSHDHYPVPPGFRLLSILVVAAGMTYLVITASLTALVGRSTTAHQPNAPEHLTNTLLWLNAGGPLVVIIGWTLRDIVLSRFRQAVAVACLAGLLWYGDFVIEVFF